MLPGKRMAPYGEEMVGEDIYELNVQHTIPNITLYENISDEFDIGHGLPRISLRTC